MKKILLAVAIILACCIKIDRYQYLDKTWGQAEVKALVDTTVVAFVQDGKDAWLGSGVLIDSKGTILTAAHVVEGAQQPDIKVMTSLGDVYFCDRLAINSRVDLAIVRIRNSAQRFPYSRLQKSDLYYVGQDILLIGNPHGHFWTVTKGIISRVHFYLPRFSWVFDTDALAQPGNSGGPAFNSRGEVIGILSAGYVNRGMPTGIGIAVPISEIHRFLRIYAADIHRPWPKPRLRLGDVKCRSLTNY